MTKKLQKKSYAIVDFDNGDYDNDNDDESKGEDEYLSTIMVLEFQWFKK